MDIKTLPLNIQQSVKETLCAFDRCFVYQRENGEMYTGTGVTLHSGKYDNLIGEYRASEVFTTEERIINYVKTFRSFPWHCDGVHYTGRKDWKALNSNWTDVSLVNGDLVFNN